MFHICEMVLDADGRVLSREELPYLFLDADRAVKFLDCFIGEAFATGKTGCQLEDGYWWGCDGKAEIKLYRYTVSTGWPAGLRAAGIPTRLSGAKYVSPGRVFWPAEARPPPNCSAAVPLGSAGEWSVVHLTYRRIVMLMRQVEHS
jgi:hypothetical protein